MAATNLKQHGFDAGGVGGLHTWLIQGRPLKCTGIAVSGARVGGRAGGYYLAC